MSVIHNAPTAPIIGPDDSILKRLRDAAMVERNELIRFLLRGEADKIDAGIKAMAKKPTPQSMIDLNGMWVTAINVLAKAGGPPGNGGNSGGPTEGALLQVAA